MLTSSIQKHIFILHLASQRSVLSGDFFILLITFIVIWNSVKLSNAGNHCNCSIPMGKQMINALFDALTYPQLATYLNTHN